MRQVARLRSVTVLYDKFPALANCNFDALEGEVVFLRGANGSGKTTLLRLLAGLIEPARGEAIVFGRDLSRDRSVIREEVTYLAHSYHMYEDLTADENLLFFASVAHFSEDEARGWAARFGLGPRELKSRFGALSAGQRKKVSISVALARRSELVLVDEPHALLDRAAKTTLDSALREAAADGRTVIVASHELNRVQSLADRTYEVANGGARDVTANMDLG
ncbi:MAG: ABC transporter ATP-binding protein [Ferrimicrobium sp.]